jgi:hypothetical protein
LIHFLRHGKSGREKLGSLFAPLLILPSIAMLVLNAILIAQLRPQMSYRINNFETSTFRMGFFSPLEISQIQSESYAKTSTVDQQIIGNLSDVYSSIIYHYYTTQCRDYDYDTGTYGEWYNCTGYYTEIKYLHQIPCSSQSVQFYKDCANASNLTIYVTTKDWVHSRFSSTFEYNCHVNQANKTCASLCTQLLANYQLFLVQEFIPNHVQAAWTGLKNCRGENNVQLKHNSSLNPCSRTKGDRRVNLNQTKQLE